MLGGHSNSLIRTRPPDRSTEVSATKTNAELIGRLEDLGTLEGGKLADILVIDGNPLKKMIDIANSKVIIQGGIIYEPDQLLPMFPSMNPPSSEED